MWGHLFDFNLTALIDQILLGALWHRAADLWLDQINLDKYLITSSIIDMYTCIHDLVT